MVKEIEKLVAALKYFYPHPQVIFISIIDAIEKLSQTKQIHADKLSLKLLFDICNFDCDDFGETLKTHIKVFHIADLNQSVDDVIKRANELLFDDFLEPPEHGLT